VGEGGREVGDGLVEGLVCEGQVSEGKGKEGDGLVELASIRKR
jgi:hypothetical protein